jgi:hypothetical protein
MKINISNYEIFALDYLEGNLEIEDVAAMQSFLQAHPKIANELEALKEMVCLVPDESIVFVPKRRLLKPARLAIVWSNQQIWVTLGSAAALVVLIFVAYIFYCSDAKEVTSPVAQVPVEQIDTIKTQNASEIATKTLNVLTMQEQNDNNKSVKRQNVQNGSSYDKKIKKSAIAILPNNTMTMSLLENKEYEKIDMTETIVSTPIKMTIAELPKRELSSLSIAYNQVIHERQQAIALHDSRKNNRFELDKVKQYLAKLPFEDLTVAHFIPSYFLNNQKGKNLF